MVLGPLTGGLSVLVGTFLSVAFGKPLAFDGLDFVPSVAAAVTAGLATSKRLVWAVSLSLALFALFTVDPLSPKFITVGGIPIPFLWMHVLSVIVFLFVITRANANSSVKRGALIAAVVFISTMNAHVAGGIMFENVLVRLNGVLTPGSISAIWTAAFFVYPVERAFFTLAGSILAIPVLRRMPNRILVTLRGEDWILAD